MTFYNDDTLMPFGLHKGTKLGNVPDHYLIWLYEKSGLSEGPLKVYIRNNLEAMKQNIKRNTRNNAR